MILTLMLVILTATLVIVIVGFVMDRLEMRKIRGGMRTLNKRIKRLEKTSVVANEFDESLMTPQMINEALSAMEADRTTYVDQTHLVGWEIGGTDDDTQTDSETQEADGGDILDETDDTVQNAGD